MAKKSYTELQQYVGRSHVTVEGLHIERGKVSEFAKAIKDDKLADVGGGSNGHGCNGMVVPLTFTRTAFFPRYRPERLADLDDEFAVSFGFELGFDPRRTLHAEQAYDFERQPHIGDTLHGITTITDISRSENDERSLTFATFKTEYRDDNDDLVVIVRTTNVEVIETGALE